MPFIITYFYLYSYLEPINFIGIFLLVAVVGTFYMTETNLLNNPKSETETELLPAGDTSMQSSYFYRQDAD